MDARGRLEGGRGTDPCHLLGPPWPKDVGESIQTGVSGQGHSSGRQVLDLSLSPSSASGGLHDLGHAV